jgi:hypothetical protein
VGEAGGKARAGKGAERRRAFHLVPERRRIAATGALYSARSYEREQQLEGDPAALAEVARDARLVDHLVGHGRARGTDLGRSSFSTRLS